MFLTGGYNRLCSSTNQGELCTDVLLGRLTKLGMWLCFGVGSVLDVGQLLQSVDKLHSIANLGISEACGSVKSH